MIFLIVILVIALVLTNYGWLYAFVKINDRWHDKEHDLLNRLNIALNKPPMPANRPSVKPGEKAPNELQPRAINDALVDPEWEAVGRIDPSFIDRARQVNNGDE